MFDFEEDVEYCNECRAYGDDYTTTKDGEMINNCVECPYNSANWEE